MVIIVFEAMINCQKRRVERIFCHFTFSIILALRKVGLDESNKKSSHSFFMFPYGIWTLHQYYSSLSNRNKR